jgi:hypothetical protein
MPNLVFLSLDKNSLQPFLGGLYAVIHKQTDFFDVACLRFSQPNTSSAKAGLLLILILANWLFLFAGCR